ncbi:MAG TPA: hypothetical protein VM582_00710, partial [Candidatus Thermoplasmatota archaeon]|nr:hypothetical protein [Candidatus Thermoplasmatota archaeon]
IHGERAFVRTLLVTGRLFALLPAPLNEEGVLVNATPLTSNATVELRAGDEVLVSATAPPDEHGRYRAELAVEDIPPGALVRVTVGRDGSEELVSPLHRRADVNVIRDLRLARGPGADAPGSTTTPAPAWLLVAAIVGAAALAPRKPK